MFKNIIINLLNLMKNLHMNKELQKISSLKLNKIY